MADELKVSVRVTPDTSGFQPAVDSDVKKQLASHPIKIPVDLTADVAAIRKAAEGIQQTLQNSIKPVSMPITLDDKAIKQAVEQTVNTTAKSLKAISVDKWAEQQSAKVSSIYRKIGDADLGLKSEDNQLAVTSRLVETQSEIDKIAQSSAQITASQRQLIDDMLDAASKLSEKLQKEEAKAAQTSTSPNKSNKNETTYEANLRRILNLEEQLANTKSSSKSNVYQAQIQDLEAVNNELLDAIAAQKNFNQSQKEQYAIRKSLEAASGTTHSTKMDSSLEVAKQNAQSAIDQALKMGGGYDVELLKNVQTQLDDIGKTNTDVAAKEISDLNIAVASLLDNLKQTKSEGSMPVNKVDVDNAVASLKELGTRWSALFSDSNLSSKYTNIMKQFNTASTEKEFKEAQNAVKAFRAEVVSAGKNTVSWADRMSHAIQTLSRYWSISEVFQALKRVMSDMVQQVTELDAKVVDLQIASGKSRNEVKAMVKDYAALGKELGATATAVAEASDTFLRQGMSVKDSNELIKDSMYLSKLGQIDSAEASKALTSALKGYKVEADNVIDIVYRLTAIDMQAAVSSGDLATAMAQTAVSANSMGIEMEQLLGMLTVMMETTQEGPEVIGNTMKTVLSRMGNIKAGNLVDPETDESLSDVEATLNGLGIRLRESNSEFRNFGDVLDEVAGRWKEFSTVQQSAIAVAFAGTRQRERFLTLMSGYEDAARYANVAAEASGTAEAKYSAYMDSIGAKSEAFQAQFQELSSSIIDSELVKGVYDAGTGILGFLTDLIDTIGLLPTLTGAAGIGAFLKNIGQPKLTGCDWAYLHLEEAS